MRLAVGRRAWGGCVVLCRVVGLMWDGLADGKHALRTSDAMTSRMHVKPLHPPGSAKLHAVASRTCLCAGPTWSGTGT